MLNNIAEEGGEKVNLFVCNSCGARFSTDLDLQAHLFRNYHCLEDYPEYQDNYYMAWKKRISPDEEQKDA